MHRTRMPARIAALALAVAIVASLFSTIVGHMPPDFAGSPGEARYATGATPVAIVPSRIEVIGVRTQDTAANAPAAPRPRT